MGNIKAADKVLANDKKSASGKARFLYFTNRGVANSFLGEYELSNDFLEKAYIFVEDYQRNYLNEAVSFLSNPNFVVYPGEDHEKLLIHYYKALNFLKINDRESALVECRRMDIKLQQLSDKYKSDKKYKRDAFIHTLMGIIYDADHDYNNAFIAYRNALNIYREDYNDLFGMRPPRQLKKDLLRTAYMTGFYDELAHYEKDFNMKYLPGKQKTGDLVFFWNNGMGPVKSEWGITFTIVKGEAGFVHFRNDEHGFSFPFFLPDDDDDDDKDKRTDLVEDLRIVRVVFPKYVERPPLFTDAFLQVKGKNYKLHFAENVNDIAFKTLQERMLEEFGRALLRFSLKKLAEKQARDQNEGLGALVGIFNAATEKADTRNWQTIPHSIYYARIPLPEGNQQVSFHTQSKLGKELNQKHQLSFNVKPGGTIFHTFHSLEISPEYRRSGYY